MENQGTYFKPKISYSPLTVSDDYRTLTVTAASDEWNRRFDFSYNLTEQDLGLSGTHRIELYYEVFVYDEKSEETQKLSAPLLAAIKNVLGPNVKVTDDVISKIYELDLSRQNLKGVAGLSAFGSLYHVDLSHNEFTLVMNT